MTALASALKTAARNATMPSALMEADLAEVERILVRTVTARRGHVAKLVNHVERYRGKRLRPILLLLTARACGQVSRAHHILAAVVEMIHTATLVHDDVLDEAQLRRHVPTINAHWGNKASILLGDMLFSQAFHLASTVGDAHACEIIGRATDRVCEGELHQIMERGNLDLSESEYLDIIDGKTAELTACCCRLGALYAGADELVVEQMSDFGRCLGTAFQIADDLLDLTGREDATGKTLGTDLHQQKLTLPIIHMLQRLPAEKAAQARRLLAEPPMTRESWWPLLQETGAVQYARHCADEHAAKARHALRCIPASDARDVLESLTDWSIRREK